MKDLLVIVPAMHLFCCFLYLFCYYLAFGHGLIYLASPTEVFSVSLSEVAPAYISVGVGSLLGVWSYETDGEIKERYSEKGSRVVKWVKDASHWLTIALAILSAIVGMVTFITSGFIFWYLFLFAVVIFSMRIMGQFLGVRSVDKITTISATFGFVAISLVGFNGLNDGQNAAKIRIDISELKAVTCGEFYIIKDVSDRFLAVDVDNNRVIVDKECQATFKVIAGEDLEFDAQPVPFAVISKWFIS